MYKYIPASAASKVRIILFLAMSSTLVACTGDDLALDDSHTQVVHYEKYPIEVTRGPVKLEISSERGTLQSSQINAISGFARSASNSSSSRITILRPSGGGASGGVARETYQLLVQSGISPGMIMQKTYPGSSKSPVQLTYIRSVAVTKECGDWTTDMAQTSGNEPYSNYGCSVQNNMAAMAANPDDFVVPRPTTPALAATRTSAITTGGSSAASTTASTTP